VGGWRESGENAEWCFSTRAFWLRTNVKHIVAAYESVSILALELPMNVLFCLLHCDVHVAVKSHQDSLGGGCEA